MRFLPLAIALVCLALAASADDAEPTLDELNSRMDRLQRALDRDLAGRLDALAPGWAGQLARGQATLPAVPEPAARAASEPAPGASRRFPDSRMRCVTRDLRSECQLVASRP